MVIHSLEGDFPVEFVRSTRKTIALQVFADGRIVVRAPKRIPEREVMRFLEVHMEWILAKRQELVKREQGKQKRREQYGIPDYETLDAAQKSRIRIHFLERLEWYAPRMGVSYQRVTIRNQKGRWGSCSSKGNLNFNYRLHYLPQELMDYVVIHELAHRVYMNHSPEFWSLVERFMPDYKACQKSLRDIGIQ